MLREALVNLRRNILVVTGAVLAVFISLGLAFSALAVNELVRINTIAWQQGVHLIVWLNDAGRDGVPSDAHENLLAEVLGWDEVANAYYVDKTAAYEEYLDLFGDNPEMVEALQNPSALPTSIRIELADIELYEQVEFRLQQKHFV